MFSTFTTSNFDTPIEIKTVKIAAPIIDDKSSSTDEKLKLSSRSRYGCLTCRKKKKRCDELKPVCGLCLKQNHSCHWKIPGTERRNRRRKADNGDPAYDQVKLFLENGVNLSHDTLPVLESKADPLPNTEVMMVMSPEKIEHSGLTPLLDFNNDQNDLVKSPSFFISLQDILNPRYESKMNKEEQSDSSKNSQYTQILDKALLPSHVTFLQNLRHPQLLYTPSSSLTKGLDDQGIYFLDYYRTCVATTVSIAPVESNYFLNFYLPMASVDKSVLFAIIGWGGMFFSGSKDNVAHSYYIKNSINLYREKLRSEKLKKEDILVLLTTLTILLAAEVCVGDVKQWYVFFEELYQIIKGYGLKALIRDFDNSNELRWLILNFLYHDVLASRSLKNGTFFTMIEYKELLKTEDELKSPDENFTLKLTEADYGADPLQGCVKPLYMVIGEIINVSVALQKEAEYLEQLELESLQNFESREDSDYMFTNFDCISLKQQVYELHNKTEAEFKRIDEKIINSKPNDIALSYLNNDSELELHLTLFEAYQLTAQLYLRMLVLKRLPVSSDMQRLLHNLTNCTDILVGSKVQASLCFPLLVAGLQCVSKLDRLVMTKRFEHMISNFPVMNFKLVKKILEEAWLKSVKGETCVKWSEVADELGWNLCVS